MSDTLVSKISPLLCDVFVDNESSCIRTFDPVPDVQCMSDCYKPLDPCIITLTLVYLYVELT